MTGSSCGRRERGREPGGAVPPGSLHQMTATGGGPVTDESGDSPSLTPWERETVAWMDEELDLRDPGLPPPAVTTPGRVATGPRPMLFGGAAAFSCGIVVAVTARAPLDVAGWILVLIGLVTVWEWL